MTTTIALLVFVGLPLAVLVGAAFACHRLKGSLRTRDATPATLVQALAKTFGGGGGGPIEPF